MLKLVFSCIILNFVTLWLQKMFLFICIFFASPAFMQRVRKSSILWQVDTYLMLLTSNSDAFYHLKDWRYSFNIILVIVVDILKYWMIFMFITNLICIVVIYLSIMCIIFYIISLWIAWINLKGYYFVGSVLRQSFWSQMFLVKLNARYWTAGCVLRIYLLIHLLAQDHCLLT